MEWFTAVEEATTKVPLSTLPMSSLLELSKVVMEGYQILYGKGLIHKILSDDLTSNINRVRSTLEEMERERSALAIATTTIPTPSTLQRPGLDYDPATGPTLAHLTAFSPTPDSQGVYGVRWISRTLQFVVILLGKLGADLDLSISKAGRETYAVTIGPYHAPVMSFVVRCVLYWAPSRQWALHNSLGGATNEATSAACTRLSQALCPIPEAITAHLESKGLNFKDVISSVPGGF